MSNAENVTDWNVTTCPGEVSEASFLWRGIWILSTVYNANDSVSNGGSSYICILPHTAAADSEPGEGANWELYWDVMALGGETINWKGAWDVGTAYDLFDSVEHLGDSWIANTATLAGDEPGVSPKWDLSAAGGQDGVSFIWQGLWVVQDYVVNDVVFFDQGGAIGGSAYICILDTTAQQDPTNATYWDIMASGGADGAGSGDVTGSGPSTAGNFTTYLDATGKTIVDGGTPGTLAFLSEVNSGTIADGSVTAAELATDAVETIKILNANVTDAKLATNAVTTAKVLDNNITLPKLSQLVANRFLGRQTGTGNVEQLTSDTASAVLDNATDPFLRTSAAGGGSTQNVRFKLFLTSGSFVKATDLGANVDRIKVTVIAGGGSGAPRINASTRSMGGGAGGGMSQEWLDVASLGASETVTVGAGGAAATGDGTNGNAGATSSFGAFLSATGGAGGVSTGAASTAGIGLNGNINFRGGGGSSHSNNNGNPTAFIATGGGSPMSGETTANVAIPGAFPGGGGTNENHVAGGSGAGAAGLVLVEWVE